MKLFIISILLIIPYFFGKSPIIRHKAIITYYISATGNSGNSGTSTGSPWDFSKVNSFAFASGDVVLFKTGDVFYGSISNPRAGVTYDSYGGGIQPIITGLTTVTSWTNLGGNIWESTSAVSALTVCNLVLVNGVNATMGRLPNTGYYTYQSYTATCPGGTPCTGTSVTSTSVNSATLNLNSATSQIVVKKIPWIVNTNKITGHSGNTISFSTTDKVYSGVNNFGFYVQNDPRFLDIQNEWFFDPTTKKLRIYSTSMPTNVQLSTIDTLAVLDHKSGITIQNIKFLGSNNTTMSILSCPNLTIQDNIIDYSGFDGVSGAKTGGTNSSSFIFQRNSINHISNNALELEREFPSAYIGYNTILNTGMNPSGAGISNYQQLVAIQTRSNGVIIEYNTIDNVGYIGIAFYNDNTIVRFNFINHCTSIVRDGGGIYSFGGPFTGQKVYNNIVLNSLGNAEGTSNTSQTEGHGIYSDDFTGNTEYYNNTVAFCSYAGYLFHNCNNIYAHNNTGFENGTGFSQPGVLLLSDNGRHVNNTRLLNNIFVNKTVNKEVISFRTTSSNVSEFASSVANIDYNKYSNPINETNTVEYVLNYSGGTYNHTTKAGWTSYSGYDVHTGISPLSLSDPNDILFIYNATTSSVDVPLSFNYMDMLGVTYNGTITLAPYTSAILLKNGAIIGTPITSKNFFNSHIIH